MEYRETNFSLRDYKSFWNKAIELTIIALVILVPSAFYPYIIDIFNPVKYLIFEILVILGMMFWGFKILEKEEIKFISTPLNLPIISFISICTLSLLWSDSLFVSLKELPLFLTGPLLYFIVVNNIHSEKQVSLIITLMVFVGGLFGVYGIFQYNGIDFPFWIGNYGRGKVFGLFGNVGYFAEYLILPLPIAISLFLVSKNRIKKILLFIGILVIGGGLLVTFTRGPYLATGISIIFMILLFITYQSKDFLLKNKKVFILVLVVIILVTFLFMIPNPLNKSGTFISGLKNRILYTQLDTDSSLRRRIAIWKFTIPMIKERPLFGSGIGTFKYNTLRYQAKFFDQVENRRFYPYGIADKAHNEYLQIVAEVGIFGLGIFLWIIFSYFNHGIKLLKRLKDKYKQGIIIGLMGSVTAFLIDSFLWFPLHLPATVVLFWLALGLTVVLGLGGKGNTKEISKIQEDYAQKEKIKKELKENIKNLETVSDNKNEIYKFKPLLYISVLALTIILTITVARPFIARTYWFKAYRNIESENWNKTINIYQEALKWDPYLGEVYYDIGKILLNQEFYIPALENFKKAEKYVDHPNLPLDFAKIYLKKGMLEEAVTKIKQAISYQSDEKSMVPLYSELGNTYLRLGRYKPAEIAFKNALKINPKYVIAHYGLAGAYLRQNKLDEAQEELQKVIELAPDSQEANYARNIIQQISQTKTKLKSQPTETNNP